MQTPFSSCTLKGPFTVYWQFYMELTKNVSSNFLPYRFGYGTVVTIRQTIHQEVPIVKNTAMARIIQADNSSFYIWQMHEYGAYKLVYW